MMQQPFTSQPLLFITQAWLQRAMYTTVRNAMFYYWGMKRHFMPIMCSIVWRITLYEINYMVFRRNKPQDRCV